MPALDQCEPQVIRALQKAGWVVTHQPYAIRVERKRSGHVFADLRLQQKQNRQIIIVIEVKCFANPKRLMDEFYAALGQYIVYRNALKLRRIKGDLYLSVPLNIYSTFFQRSLIQSSVRDVGAKLVIVDLEVEEIVSWIT